MSNSCKTCVEVEPNIYECICQREPKTQEEKYAVMVPFDGDMMYVTEGDSKFQLREKLFDTRQKAVDHASLWGENAVVVEWLPILNTNTPEEKA
jgi:hypothetical protein